MPNDKPKPQQKRGTKKSSNTPSGARADSAQRIEAFCLAYHAKPNGQEAAVAAGYSPKTASAQAS